MHIHIGEKLYKCQHSEYRCEYGSNIVNIDVVLNKA